MSHGKERGPYASPGARTAWRRRPQMKLKPTWRVLGRTSLSARSMAVRVRRLVRPLSARTSGGSSTIRFLLCTVNRFLQHNTRSTTAL